MQTRRAFLLTAAGAALTVSAPVFVRAANNATHAPTQATAITQVFGDGVKLMAIVLTYPHSIQNSALNAQDFSVAGRTISKVFTAQSISLTPSEAGQFVIVQLAETDANTSLQEDVYEGDPEAAKPQM